MRWTLGSPPSISIDPRWRTLAAPSLLLALAYFLAARFGLTFGSINNSASLIWAPSGISLAALIWFGPRVLAGVFLGAGLTVLSSRLPLIPSILILCANAFVPLTASWLLKRLEFHSRIDRVRDAVALIAVGGICTTAFGALLGTYALYLAGIITTAGLTAAWETWWVGDFFGVIIVTPLLLVLANDRSPLLSRPRFLEGLVFLGFLAFYGLLVFGRQHPGQNFRELPVAFGIFPFAIWAAIRFEQTGTVLLTFTVTAVTLTATLLGNQLLPRSPIETLLPLQIYIGMAAATGLILAAAIIESKRALEVAQENEIELITVNEHLENRVKERTRELEQGKRQLAEAQELAHVGSWEWDVIQDRITWSDELHRIYGLSQGELSFKEFVNRIHPEDRAVAIATLKEAAEKRACYDFIYRIVRPDENVRSLHSRGSAQTDADGKLLKLLGTAQDITGQREAESKLRQYLVEIRDLYNHAPCGYHSLDLNGLYLEVNDTEVQLLGYSREELLRKMHFTDLLTSESQYLFREAFARFRQGENLQQLELEVVRKCGTRLPILMNATPIRDDHGQIVRSRSSFIDLTERKKAENQKIQARQAQFAREEAEASAQRSAFLAEATQVLVSSLDQEEVLERIARLAVPQVSDWCVIDLTHDSTDALRRVIAHRDPTVEAKLKALNTKFPTTLAAEGGSAEVIRSGRSYLVSRLNDEAIAGRIQRHQEYADFVRELGPCSYMSVPMSVRNHTIGAISFLSTDSKRHFTEADRALAEELGRRAALAIENARLYQLAREAVSTRDEFLSIASHELKTPITSLKLRLQMAKRSLLQSHTPGTEGLAKVFDISHAQVERLNSLIDDLLDVSRIQAGKLTLNPEEFELGALVREVVSRFTGDAPPGLFPVKFLNEQAVLGCWDKARLEQVILNILSNATKYAPQSPIHISVSSAGGNARLEFRDFGPGIPAEKHDRIFDRYERVTNVKHTSGLGLGLFIVRQIVQAHQGNIWVESAVGKGTCFVIELPLLTVRREFGIRPTRDFPAQAQV